MQIAYANRANAPISVLAVGVTTRTAHELVEERRQVLRCVVFATLPKEVSRRGLIVVRVVDGESKKS